MSLGAIPSDLQISVEKALREKDSFKEGKIRWVKLPGDASNRSYYRLLVGEQPCILMVMNALDAFKSEEGSATGQNLTAKKQELDFVQIARDWKAQRLPVPEIYFVGPDSRFLVLEDFGEELLYDAYQKDGAKAYYEKAMELLARIQRAQPLPCISARSFSAELLKWEFEHFVEYALVERKVLISPAALLELRTWMDRVVKSLSAMEPVVVHRDYHSKNIMIRSDGDLGLIDFQDALLGPRTYDLASLLRDSYVTLSDAEEERLIKLFEEASSHRVDRQLYIETSLQRNMKAVGRFFYIQIVKGKDTHIPFVAPSLRRIFKSLKSLNEDRVLEILQECLKTDSVSRP